MIGSAQFSGKTVVITGGSRGIGAAIALEFAKRGAMLVLGYENESPARERTIEKLNGISSDIVWVKGDVADPSTTEKLCVTAVSRWGRLDHAIANAGVYHYSPFGRIRKEQLERIIAVNQLGVFYLLKAAGKIMKQKRSGTVVTVSSAAVNRLPKMIAVYAGTKAFVETITKGFAVEYSPYGVRANAVAPGIADTEMNRVAIGVARASLASTNLMNRIADPAEIADAVLFLCSRAASFINGQVLRVDGGGLSGI
jgi:NAD(P)-dependent dehydrogenase (short-subunit alcohol dehydrogenase family)